MKSVFIALICLANGWLAYGQSQDPPRQVDPRSHLVRPALRISYVGNQAWQPGISIGIEQPIWQKHKSKVRKIGKVKQKTRMWLATADLGAWVHPNSYSAQFLRGGMMWRKVRNRGGKFEAAMSLGLANRFNIGKTYAVSEDGEVKSSFWDSRFYFMPTLSLGFGKDHLFAKKSRPFAWHLRPNVSLWMPYNTTVVPAMGLELGVSLYLDKLKDLKIFAAK